MNRKLIVCALAALIAAPTVAGLTGCTEKDKVSWNVSQDADNFNAVRRLTVINTLSDKVLLQMTGTFAIQTDSDTNELQVICELEDGRYQKHFIYLNKFTTYTVEDISGSDVDKYSYELNFMPEFLPGVKITAND